MIAGTLAWLAGIVALQLQQDLPGFHLLWLVPAVALLAWRYRCWRWIAFGVAGFLWALFQAHWVLDRELAAPLEGRDVIVTGRVVGIPEVDAERLRFRFAIQGLVHQGREYASPGLVRLNWYRDYPQLTSGESWRLVVRLKRPRGFSNPGGFDYEGWLYREGIRATGYVRAGGLNQRLSGANALHGSVDRLRAAGIDKIHGYLRDSEFHGLVTTLVFGHRDAIHASQWEVLRRTGTSHLIAISGLHIGLVAGMIFKLVRHIWTLWPAIALWVAAPRAAGVAAVTGALGYAALAGFSIPTQRALIMVVVAMGAVIAARALRPVRTLFLALFLLLVWDPAAVLSPGFWLSFGAVGVILWVLVGEHGSISTWYRWVRVQGAVTLGLFPLLAIAFGQVSLVAPVANLIAIPWIGFMVVPTALLGAVLMPFSNALAALLFHLADAALAVIWWPLQWLAGLPVALWQVAEPPLWSVPLGVAGVLVLLLPPGFPLRGIGGLLLVPMLVVSVHPPVPDSGFRLTLLDVGQGMAVVVRTASHTLLYDAGPRYGDRFNTGAAVVVPYLRSLGITRLDRLIVSHGDSDHAGGVGSVIASMRLLDLKRAPDPGEQLRAGHCQAGMRWTWDGVEFTILHPRNRYDDPGAENDHSCVLRVRAGRHGVLLTGDIERSAESELLRMESMGLRSDLIVVPHHGSATSSSDEFVDAVRPTMAWVSAGYANRWGFPKPEVVDRYRRIGAPVWTTAEYGALEIAIDPRRGLGEPRRWREESRRYWNAAFGGQGKSSTIAPLVLRLAD